MNEKSRIYKYVIIYIYLLVFIACILYKYPGIVDHHKKKIVEEQIYNHEQYILGEYIHDQSRFQMDGMYFPVALPGQMDMYIYFADSYGADRTYGGDRIHEGCDIMTISNIRGELPVVSVCDGIVEKMGWLELGGYRIGIRSESGVYYYYAHLHSYEPGISEGDKVLAGQIIGYVGDTGYSKVEGTTGNFDVHLHFGIYLNDEYGQEYALNPYPLLKELEDSVINYRFINHR